MKKMAEMKRMYDETSLGKKVKLKLIFVSVDPDKDTDKDIDKFLSHFDN